MSDVGSLSDDEAITTAVLLGCTFFQPVNAVNEFYVDSNIGEAYRHPLEAIKYKYDRQFFAHGWRSRAELARDWIDWKLGKLTDGR